MFAAAADALGGFADEELRLEADMLHDLSHSALNDDVRRTAKLVEAERHRKSRRRGLRDV